MNFKFDDDAMRSLMAKAILDTVSAENQQAMLETAVSNFINKPDEKDYVKNKRTPLEQAFEYAANDVARKVIEAKFSDDKVFRARVDALVSEAITKAFADENRDKMLDNMVNAVCAAFKVRDRY